MATRSADEHRVVLAETEEELRVARDRVGTLEGALAASAERMVDVRLGDGDADEVARERDALEAELRDAVDERDRLGQLARSLPSRIEQLEADSRSDREWREHRELEDTTMDAEQSVTAAATAFGRAVKKAVDTARTFESARRSLGGAQQAWTAFSRAHGLETPAGFDEPQWLPPGAEVVVQLVLGGRSAPVAAAAAKASSDRRKQEDREQERIESRARSLKATYRDSWDALLEREPEALRDRIRARASELVRDAERSREEFEREQKHRLALTLDPHSRAGLEAEMVATRAAEETPEL